MPDQASFRRYAIPQRPALGQGMAPPCFGVAPAQDFLFAVDEQQARGKRRIAVELVELLEERAGRKIAGPDVHADGDRYMDLDPTVFDGLIANNRIFVTIKGLEADGTVVGPEDPSTGETADR